MLKSYRLFENYDTDDIFPDAELLSDVLYGIPDLRFKILPSLYRTKSIRKKDWFGGILVDENRLFHKEKNSYLGYLEIDSLKFGKLELPQGWTLKFDRIGNDENGFENGRPTNNAAPCLSLALKPIIPIGTVNSNGKTHLIKYINDKNLTELMRELLDKLENLEMKPILVSEIDSNGVFWMVIMDKKYFHER